jgi:uncharacterized protein YajQ (UPF0234 family)
MPPEFSFDIASKPDLTEVDNAIQMSLKEILNRFDFKGTKTTITKEADKLTIVSDDDFKLNAVIDILKGRLIKRGVSIKFFDWSAKPEDSLGGTKRLVAKIKSGIPQEQAKEISKKIKDWGLKVRTQIQGEEVRVFSKSKDDLQVAIQSLKKAELPVELQFINFR